MPRYPAQPDTAASGSFNPQPYRQFETVLSGSGNKDGATQAAYWAREQEESTAYQNRDWPKWAGLAFLWVTVGYGIGPYIFRALYWALALMVIGAVVLGRNDVARERGIWWRLQASLDRLLPVVQLSPEFDEFFRRPDVHRLKTWQVLFFSGVSISGWVLGAFLAAAVSGLTQGSS